MILLELTSSAILQAYKRTIQKSILFLQQLTLKLKTPYQLQLRKNAIMSNNVYRTSILKTVKHYENIKYINQWRVVSSPYIERLNTVKMSILSKVFYRISEISIKTLTRFLQTQTNYPKVYMEDKDTIQGKAILKRKN